ncbi:MAG: hypothetical protein AAGA85_21660 [Bacteroidota bacterium]
MGQTKIATTEACESALFSPTGPLILFGSDQITLLDSSGTTLLQKKFEGATLSHPVLRDDILLFRVTTATDQVKEELTELDLASLSFVTSTRLGIDVSKERTEVLGRAMESPIRHADRNPFDTAIAVSVSRDGIQLNHIQEQKKHFQARSGISKAYFTSKSQLIVLQNEQASMYWPGQIEASQVLAEGVQDITVSYDRSRIGLLLEDRTEIWQVAPSPKSLVTTQLGPLADELISSLQADDFSTYLVFKEAIDDEIDLKYELFVPQKKKESTADFEERKEDAQKHFNEIIEHYGGLFQTSQEVVQYAQKTAEDGVQALNSYVSAKSDSIRAIDDERQLFLTAERVKKSYEEFNTKIESIGTYDTSNEQYLVSIDGQEVPFKINLAEARSFKLDAEEHLVVGAKQLDKMGEDILTLGYQIMTPDGDIFRSSDYQKPLFIPEEQQNRLLVWITGMRIMAGLLWMAVPG